MRRLNRIKQLKKAVGAYCFRWGLWSFEPCERQGQKQFQQVGLWLRWIFCSRADWKIINTECWSWQVGGRRFNTLFDSSMGAQRLTFLFWTMALKSQRLVEVAGSQIALSFRFGNTQHFHSFECKSGYRFCEISVELNQWLRAAIEMVDKPTQNWNRVIRSWCSSVCWI